MPEAHRFCAACGKELVPNGNFCPFCGVRVGEVAPTHDGKTVDECWDDLVSHDGGARVRALRAFERLGSKADAAVAKMVASLKDRYPERLAAEALLQLGRHADEAARKILDGMTGDESLDVRLTCFGSIMKCGGRAAPAAPALREILRDALRGKAAFDDVAENSARALGWIGEAAADAVYELTDALKHADAKVREAAAWSLGRMGARAKSAVAALKEASKDTAAGVAKEAKKALKQIG
jgi:HEAT repeat protein